MILGSLGRPLGRPWVRFCVINFEAKKVMQQKVGKLVASAGDADPGQDPPAGFFRKIRHAFAHPNGWTGGLFALRVTRRGDLEVGSFEASSL